MGSTGTPVGNKVYCGFCPASPLVFKDTNSILKVATRISQKEKRKTPIPAAQVRSQLLGIVCRLFEIDGEVQIPEECPPRLCQACEKLITKAWEVMEALDAFKSHLLKRIEDDAKISPEKYLMNNATAAQDVFGSIQKLIYHGKNVGNFKK